MLVSEALESIDRWPLISDLLHESEEEDKLVIEALDSFPTSTELVLEVAKSEYLEDMDGLEALDILVMDDSSSRSSEG